MRQGITHEVAEQRSIALHREVARRLRLHPEHVDRARRRVEGWARDGSASEHWTRAWLEVLSGRLEDILEAIVDPGERGRSLRQSSPFAGVIDAKTRWRILRECEAKRRMRDA
jgi:hypothetical protein